MSQDLNESPTALSTAEKLDRLSKWLTSEEDVIKRGGIAKKAGLDKGTLSRHLTGRLGIEPRAETIDKLVSIAQSYGFSLT